MTYTELNAKLVEEFGNLERLCNQMYNAQHGVSCYIEDMERTYGGSSRVANWERDLRQLKDIRHKRNQLSHGNVSFTSPLAESEDIDFILDFHNRIMNCTDPLSKNRRIVKAGSAEKPSSTQNNSQATDSIPPKSTRQPVGCGACIAIVSTILLAILWLLSNI